MEMRVLHPAGPVPPPAVLPFASLTGTWRMGKHLQFGKGGFFSTRRQVARTSHGMQRQPPCTGTVFSLPSLYRTAITLGRAENTQPENHEPPTPGGRTRWQHIQEACAPLSNYVSIFFFSSDMIIWAVGISFPPRHALRCCCTRPAVSGKRRMLSCMQEDVEPSAIFNMGSHREMIPGSGREEAARCSRNADQRLLGFYQHA